MNLSLTNVTRRNGISCTDPRQIAGSAQNIGKFSAREKFALTSCPLVPLIWSLFPPPSQQCQDRNLYAVQTVEIRLPCSFRALPRISDPQSVNAPFQPGCPMRRKELGKCLESIHPQGSAQLMMFVRRSTTFWPRSRIAANTHGPIYDRVSLVQPVCIGQRKCLRAARKDMGLGQNPGIGHNVVHWGYFWRR